MRLIDADAAVEQSRNDKYMWAYDLTDLEEFLTLVPTIDPESLRPKGRWNIRCYTTYDSHTGETDEDFYLECSECKREVRDIDQMAAMNGDYRKLIEQYPYCHCGAKMEVE